MRELFLFYRRRNAKKNGKKTYETGKENRLLLYCSTPDMIEFILTQMNILSNDKRGLSVIQYTELDLNI